MQIHDLIQGIVEVAFLASLELQQHHFLLIILDGHLLYRHYSNRLVDPI